MRIKKKLIIAFLLFVCCLSRPVPKGLDVLPCPASICHFKNSNIFIGKDNPFRSRPVFASTWYMLLYFPDDQYLSSAGDLNQLHDMFTWASTNQVADNIVGAFSVGDDVDTSNSTQWGFYTTYLANPFLASTMFFFSAAGNHDYEGVTTGATPDPTLRVATQFISNIEGPISLKSYFRSAWTPGGSVEDPQTNYYIEYTVGSRTFGLITAEFCPRTGSGQNVLAWVQSIYANNPTTMYGLITHGAENNQAQLTTSGSSGTSGCFQTNTDGVSDSTAAGGLDIWNAVKGYANVQFIAGGHYTGSSVYSATITMTGTHNNKVPIFYFNHQFDSNTAWVRGMEINPDTGEMDLTTFDPYLGTSLTDPTNQLTVFYTPLGQPGVVANGVSSGNNKLSGNMQSH